MCHKQARQQASSRKCVMQSLMCNGHATCMQVLVAGTPAQVAAALSAAEPYREQP